MEFAASILSTMAEEYFSSLVLLCIMIVGFYCCWSYWKLNRKYRNFPSYRMDLEWLPKVILGRYPKDKPFTSVLFEELVTKCRRFEKEGFCVLWFVLPYLFIYNEEFVKRFGNERAAISKPSLIYNILKDEFGNGLLTSEGKRWKSHRKMMNPVFNLALLKGKIKTFNRHAADLVTKFEAVKNKPTQEMTELLKISTFNVMAETVLGLKLSDDKHGPKIRKYEELLESVSEILVARIARPWLYSGFFLHLFPSGKRYLKQYREFHNFTKEIVDEMKETLLTSKVPEVDLEKSVENRKSIGHILLEQHLKDPTFTMEDVLDHVTTFMIGGHDTTAATLMWCLYVLGHHLDVQERALEDIRYISEEDVTYEQLCDLTYLDCIIKETSRLYPTVPLYGRSLSKEINEEDYSLPKGADIIFFPYMLHRNEKVYPDPERFDPERFSRDSKIYPWMHLLFAEGQRSCIGKRFSMLEMKVILVHILRRFEIRSLNKIEETDLEWSVMLRTVKPMNMLFTPRQSEIEAA